MSAGWQDPGSAATAHAVPTAFPVAATPRRAPFGTVEHPLPLIIDSDPGLDDALAIGLAVARPELDVLAVTTVGGNADVRHCTENALRLLHAFGRSDIPVAEGAAGPLVGDVVRATEVHGEQWDRDHDTRGVARGRGLGGRAVALMARHPARAPGARGDRADRAPDEHRAATAAPSRAGAAHRPPLDHGRARSGRGTRRSPPNSTSTRIPEAADIVFRSGVPITMMGLDVTHQALLDRASADALRAGGGTSGRIAAELTEYALDRNREWTGATTTAIHDAVAVAHFAIPDLIDVAPYHVTLDTTDGPARGRTVCDGQPYRLRRDGRISNADVGIRIDRTRFERLLIDAFAALP